MTTLATAWDLLVSQSDMTRRRLIVVAVIIVIFWNVPLAAEGPLVPLVGIAIPLLSGVALARFATRLGDPVRVRVASGLLGFAVWGLFSLLMFGGALVLAWAPGSSPLERVLKVVVPVADPGFLGFSVYILVLAIASRESGAAPLFLIGAALVALFAFLAPGLGIAAT